MLIRCQAGLNRSGLVTALVLIMAGWAPEDAIRRIRVRRSVNALCNRHFTTWLLTRAVAAVAQAGGEPAGTSPSPGGRAA